MWRRLVEQFRAAGPRKVLIVTVALVAAVVLAYGVNSSNDASGHTLARVHPHLAR